MGKLNESWHLFLGSTDRAQRCWGCAWHRLEHQGFALMTACSQGGKADTYSSTRLTPSGQAWLFSKVISHWESNRRVWVPPKAPVHTDSAASISQGGLCKRK